MATLFRFAPRPGAAIDPRQDLHVGAAEITIGRAPGSLLRLVRAGVRFHHATMAEENGALVVRAIGDATLEQNGRNQERVLLARPGDAVRIGPYTLALGEGGAGGERIVTVVPDTSAPPDEAALALAYKQLFNVALPNVRLMALGLCCVLALLFFVLPLTFAPASPPAARAGTVAAAAPPAKLSALWNVGTVSSVHSAFAKDCSYCHQGPFIRVQSSACLACHRDIGRHADPLLAPAADISKQRCETCHREHKGPVLATRNDQSDCVACHGDLKSVAPMTRLRPVRDFGYDHPQFAAALVQDASLRTTMRGDVGTPDPPDHSGLRFTHAKHLALDKLKQPGNAACAACHTPAPGGVTFRPVEFDTACASCHSLQFEPVHPEWKLPHGHPEEVASRIAGYYARAALAGETFPAPSSDLFAKPGAPLPPAALTGADMVSAQTAAAMMSSIARSACGQCHMVSKPAAGEPPEAWKVAPVYVPDRYLTRATFSHASHATTPCATCHPARTSDGGVLALLPGIATCRQCHAGQAGAIQRVASPCVSCHVFHDNTHPLLTPPAPVAALASRDSLKTEAQ